MQTRFTNCRSHHVWPKYNNIILDYRLLVKITCFINLRGLITENKVPVIGVKTHKEQNNYVLLAAKTPYQEMQFRMQIKHILLILTV